MDYCYWKKSLNSGVSPILFASHAKSFGWPWWTWTIYCMRLIYWRHYAENSPELTRNIVAMVQRQTRSETGLRPLALVYLILILLYLFISKTS